MAIPPASSTTRVSPIASLASHPCGGPEAHRHLRPARILRGEELTYDYKFPIEDTSNKLPCNCGAKLPSLP